jgi:hypothetical protein
MQKWEYKVIKTSQPTEEQLNELGAEGWELVVGAIDAHLGCVFIFKRRFSN